ncbi:MAG TPA: hypothetical protein VGN76_09025 [Gemmatimonadales bacterium]|nr:hypothetical protein [Gemmatimonadales bacterium]
MKSIWVILLAGICVGCGRGSRDQDSGSVPDSAPPVTSPPSQTLILPRGCALPTRPEELKTCIADLKFDDLELAGDDQPLSVCRTGQCTQGPRATIQPEKSSHLYREADLSRGRIIAKLFLNKDSKDRYDKLGMSPGDTTYWWVQKEMGDTLGQSYYLTVTAGRLVPKKFTLHFESYRGAPFKQALARWLWDPNDEKTQGTCSSGTCK